MINLNIYGVVFQDKGKIYYFNGGDKKIPNRVTVIVETEKGEQFGRVVTRLDKEKSMMYKAELKDIKRIEKKRDYEQYLKNLRDAEEALKNAKNFSKELNLSMNFIDANFTFDQMKSESFIGTPYPAEPTSWTKSNSGAGYQLSGVVNLAQFDDVIEKYRAYLNAISAPSGLGSSLNNNVLMIYNGDNSSQSYTSSIKNLSANKYYKITIFVNTSLWSTDASGVSIIAKTGTADNYSTIARVENIKTSCQ